ncbi:hypothetical protein ACFY2V_16975 [Streptomyces eurythermus]|uniref:hypothetical protein n=1 Tax=Streptomyces eurythermus TaxID=42237 RepID=UPI0036CB95D4
MRPRSHPMVVLEHHVHRLDRDALVFTTIAEGRAGRRFSTAATGMALLRPVP